MCSPRAFLMGTAQGLEQDLAPPHIGFGPGRCGPWRRDKASGPEGSSAAFHHGAADAPRPAQARRAPIHPHKPRSPQRARPGRVTGPCGVCHRAAGTRSPNPMVPTGTRALCRSPCRQRIRRPRRGAASTIPTLRAKPARTRAFTATCGHTPATIACAKPQDTRHPAFFLPFLKTRQSSALERIFPK